MFASGWPNPFLKPKVLWERIGVTEGSAQRRSPIFQKPDQPNTACCGFNIYHFAGVTPLINLVDLNQIFQE